MFPLIVMVIGEVGPEFYTGSLLGRYYAQAHIEHSLEPQVLLVSPWMKPLRVTVGNVRWKTTDVVERQSEFLTSETMHEEWKFVERVVASPGMIVRAWFDLKPDEVLLGYKTEGIR